MAREVIGPEFLVAGHPLWARTGPWAAGTKIAVFLAQFGPGTLRTRVGFIGGASLLTWVERLFAGAVVEARNEPAQDRR
jgi:hypothetical protein